MTWVTSCKQRNCYILQNTIYFSAHLLVSQQKKKSPTNYTNIKNRSVSYMWKLQCLRQAPLYSAVLSLVYEHLHAVAYIGMGNLTP